MTLSISSYTISLVSKNNIAYFGFKIFLDIRKQVSVRGFTIIIIPVIAV